MSSVTALHTIMKGFSQACDVDVFEDFEPTLMPFNGSTFTEPMCLIDTDSTPMKDLYGTLIEMASTPGSMAGSASFGLVSPGKGTKVDNPDSVSKVMLYIWVQSPILIESGVWTQNDDVFEVIENDDESFSGPLLHALKLLSVRATIDSMQFKTNVDNHTMEYMENSLKDGVSAFKKALGLLN
jgi:hypothetical protein